jgi:hypothetical protein
MKRAGALVLSIAMALAAGEVAARTFWWLHHGVPFAHPDRILYAYYPDLRGVDEARPARGGDAFNVLLLGGSTLHAHWGEVEAALFERFAAQGRSNVEIYNLSAPGHTSRDSLLKYMALADARFDLVLLYDGINDTRLMFAPPDIFRADYGHSMWYEVVNALAPYHGRATFALPYTLRFLAIRARQRLMPSRYVRDGEPRPDWLPYGRDLRSVEPFARNVEAVVDAAAPRGDRVMLMTFATYVPSNYSLDAFEARRLDYVLYTSPLEMWGRPDDVMRAVARENAIIHRLAAAHPEALFVDQATLLPGPGTPPFYNDVCHLTIAGSIRFAENVVRAIPLVPAAR